MQVQQQPTQPLPLKPIQIGHATFAPTITKPALKKLLKPDRQQALKRSSWMIACFSSQSSWSDIFPLMTSASNIHLRLIAGELTSAIYQQISHIHFSQLQQLNLLNNHITSAEGLVFLNAPLLQRISVSTNKISIITPLLSKISYPKLKLIDCSDNVFSQAHLGRFQVRTSEMQVYMLQQDKRIGAIQDMSVFAKCPLYLWSKSLEFFVMSQAQNPLLKSQYILQKRSAKALIKKFKQQVKKLQ